LFVAEKIVQDMPKLLYNSPSQRMIDIDPEFYPPSSALVKATTNGDTRAGIRAK
jgi:hypothetical protein